MTPTLRKFPGLSLEARRNLAQLDADYTANHDHYVQEIFSRITGA